MSESHLYVFISSKMALQNARIRLKQGLSKISQGAYRLKVWIYEEDAYAANIPIREMYLDGLRQSMLYIGLFTDAYSEWTIDEFNCAKDWDIDRYLFKREPAPRRDIRLTRFLEENPELCFDFVDEEDLCCKVCTIADDWLTQYVSRAQNRTPAHLLSPSTLTEWQADNTQLEHAWNAIALQNQHVLLLSNGQDTRTNAAHQLASRWYREAATHRQNVLWWGAGDARPQTARKALGSALHRSDSSFSLPEAETILRRLLRENHVGMIVLDNIWDTTVGKEIAEIVPRSVVILATSYRRIPAFQIIQL